MPPWQSTIGAYNKVTRDGIATYLDRYPCEFEIKGKGNTNIQSILTIENYKFLIACAFFLRYVVLYMYGEYNSVES